MPKTMVVKIYATHYGVNVARYISQDLAVIAGKETPHQAWKGHLGQFNDFYQKWIDADGSLARLVLICTDHSGLELYGIKVFKPTQVAYDIIA